MTGIYARLFFSTVLSSCYYGYYLLVFTLLENGGNEFIECMRGNNVLFPLVGTFLVQRGRHRKFGKFQATHTARRVGQNKLRLQRSAPHAGLQNSVRFRRYDVWQLLHRHPRPRTEHVRHEVLSRPDLQAGRGENRQRNVFLRRYFSFFLITTRQHTSMSDAYILFRPSSAGQGNLARTCTAPHRILFRVWARPGLPSHSSLAPPLFQLAGGALILTLIVLASPWPLVN